MKLPPSTQHPQEQVESENRGWGERTSTTRTPKIAQHKAHGKSILLSPSRDTPPPPRALMAPQGLFLVFLGERNTKARPRAHLSPSSPRSLCPNPEEWLEG